jgi:hypothetical protein
MDEFHYILLLLSGNGDDDCFLALNRFRKKMERQLGILVTHN